jgi:Tol biopolymer transport system component
MSDDRYDADRHQGDRPPDAAGSDGTGGHAESRGHEDGTRREADDGRADDRLRRGLVTLAERARPSDHAWLQISVGVRSRRSRSRRPVTLAVAGLALVVLVATVLVARHDPGTGPAQPAATGATAGAVAYVRGDDVVVVDLASGQAATVSGPTHPTALAWSADGRHLAVATASQLWLAAPDGPARPVADLAGTGGDAGTVFAWSPSGARLAVGGSSLQVVDAATGDRRGVADLPVSSLAWSNDGTRLAVTEPPRPGGSGPAGDGVAVVDVATLEVTPVVAGDAPPTGLRLAGWWGHGQGGEGLVWWRLPQRSQSLAADGAELVARSLDGGPERVLATTLVEPDWVRWSPDRSRLLVVAGGSRFASGDKRLEVCEPATGTCLPFLADPAGVQLDPAWSADGLSVLLVTAAADPGAPGAGAAGWVATRRLEVAMASGGTATPVAGAPAGVIGPTWLDGHRIGAVVAEGGAQHLAVIDAASGQVRRITPDLGGLGVPTLQPGSAPRTVAWTPARPTA